MKLELIALFMVAAGAMAFAEEKKYVDPNKFSEGKKAYVDPNPYAKYEPCWKTDSEHATYAEWQAAHAKELEAATSESQLMAFVVDAEAAGRLLARVKPGYATDPLDGARIAAVSQYVMKGAGLPWYDFWSETRDGARRVWTAALLKAAAGASDDYVREYLLDQLLWCGYAGQAADVRAIGASASARVASFAEAVASHLEGSRS